MSKVSEKKSDEEFENILRISDPNDRGRLQEIFSKKRKQNLDETNYIYDTSIDFQGICKDTKIGVAPNLLDEIDLDNHTINNQQFTVEFEEINNKGVKPQGTYGEVKKVKFKYKDENGNKEEIFCMKLPNNNDVKNITPDINAIEKLKKVNCSGIIPMKHIKDNPKFFENGIFINAILMPLADGDLLNKKLNEKQANDVINILTNVLLCMAEHDIYYFDLKVENILYKCDNNLNKANIYLGDMASIIPSWSNSTNQNYYSATNPPPFDMNDKFYEYYDRSKYGRIISEGIGFYAKKIYKYQLSLIWIELTTHIKPPMFEKGGRHSLNDQILDFINKIKQKKFSTELQKHIDILEKMETYKGSKVYTVTKLPDLERPKGSLVHKPDGESRKKLKSEISNAKKIIKTNSVMKKIFDPEKESTKRKGTPNVSQNKKKKQRTSNKKDAKKIDNAQNVSNKRKRTQNLMNVSQVNKKPRIPDKDDTSSIARLGAVIEPRGDILLKPLKNKTTIKNGFLRVHNILFLPKHLYLNKFD